MCTIRRSSALNSTQQPTPPVPTTPSPSNPLTSPPTPSPVPATPCQKQGGIDVKVDVHTDIYGGETSWTLTNNCGTSDTVTSPGYSNSNFASNSYCQTPAEYTFVITDSWGDGICCSYGHGYFSVIVDGVEEAKGGNFGSSSSHTFGTCDLTTANPTTANPTVPPTGPQP